MVSAIVTAMLLTASLAAEGNDDSQDRAPPGPCGLNPSATLPMTFDDSGGIVVPMTIGVAKISLIVDTGGIDSMLSASTVNALRLPLGHLHKVRVLMFGGYHIDDFAEAHDIVLGGLHADTMRFLVMPDDPLSPGVDGTLAPDVLRAYDDDFDFARATLKLFSPGHCPGQLVYWTKQDFTAIDFRVDRTGHILLQAEMDGAKFRVGIDTGSSRSVMGLDEAMNLYHFRRDSPNLREVHEPGMSRAYRYPFKSLTFGGVTVDNPDILLVPESDSEITGALIGMTILRRMHLYLSYREQKMYVTAASAH
jgi:predicted aspartyl protease